jgi:hypothetical protein
MGDNYRLCALALAFTACGNGGNDSADTGTTAGPSTSLTATDSSPGTDSPTDSSATGTDSSVDGTNSATDSGPTSTAPTTNPGTDPSTESGPPSTDPSTDPGTDPGTTATTDNTTTPVSGTTGTTTDDPPPPNCGDGNVDDDEECDDGANNGPEALCYANCTLNVCGDAVQSPAEQCDLGPDNGPDNGCSSECVLLPSACGNQAVMAELTPLPVDIIIVIDNSGSMSAEIQGVQDNINVNFAAILDNSGIDYRVILVSNHGDVDGQDICIEAPLSGIPMGGCNNPPNQPINNPGKFYHYSRSISSTNSWCKVLATVNGTEDDDYDFAVDGWQEWLREDSFKTFIELTDDRVNCGNFSDSTNPNTSATEALQFDTALRALFPDHFGATPETRNYRWYSIVGLAFNDPQDKPYAPMDPFVAGKCPQGVNAGYGYQALSIITGGLRFPLCNTQSYDVVFQAIADEVINSAKLACEFDIPPAPEGKNLDKDSVTVIFTPMGMGVPVGFTKVDDPNQCDATSFYLLGEKVILCPTACDSIQGNNDATVEVEFTCEPLIPN